MGQEHERRQKQERSWLHEEDYMRLRRNELLASSKLQGLAEQDTPQNDLAERRLANSVAAAGLRDTVNRSHKSSMRALQPPGIEKATSPASSFGQRSSVVAAVKGPASLAELNKE